MSGIFTKIINREIPAYILAEDDSHISFLDINPLKKGHALVIPKKEVDYIFDLEDKALSDLHLFAKRVAKAIRITVPCKRIGVVVIGLEVPHAHIHLVPLDHEGDINFSNKRVQMSPSEMESLAQRIREAFK